MCKILYLAICFSILALTLSLKCYDLNQNIIDCKPENNICVVAHLPGIGWDAGCAKKGRCDEIMKENATGVIRCNECTVDFCNKDLPLLTTIDFTGSPTVPSENQSNPNEGESTPMLSTEPKPEKSTTTESLSTTPEEKTDSTHSITSSKEVSNTIPVNVTKTSPIDMTDHSKTTHPNTVNTSHPTIPTIQPTNEME